MLSTAEMKHPVLIAHRGIFASTLENTTQGIRMAAVRRIDFVEIDLRVSADGHVVALHDETIDRTTPGTGRASEIPLSELQSLVITTLSDGTMVRIPTLEECLVAAKGRVGLILHIKDNMSPALLNTIVATCLDQLAPGKIILASRRKQVLSSLKKVPQAAALQIGRYSFLEPFLLRLRHTQPSAYDILIVNELLVSQSLVKRAHRLNVRLFASALRPIRSPGSVMELGVDGIYLNLEPG